MYSTFPYQNEYTAGTALPRPSSHNYDATAPTNFTQSDSDFTAIWSPDRSISYIHEGYVGTIARVEYVKEDRTDWYILHPDTQEWTLIDPEQLWFWTEAWQRGEREVDEDLAAGRYEDFDNIDDFIASLLD